MKTLILAGGLGTRLRSVIRNKPKSMAIIGGKPFLEYQVEQLRSYGFHQIVLCVGYLGHQIQEYFGNGKQWGVEITYSVESELLGTAGAIKNAEPFINGTFLVLNGDSYLEADLGNLVDFHVKCGLNDDALLGTLAVVKVDSPSGYGVIETDVDHRIRCFREKTEMPGQSWVNGGIYVLEPEILNFVSTGRPVSIERECFPRVIENGWHLYSYFITDFFTDIGTPEGYLCFQSYIEERKQ